MELETCKAIVKPRGEGEKRCTRPSKENGFCGKHQTAAKLEAGAAAGQKKCLTHRCVNLISSTETYCPDCLEKKADELANIPRCKAHVQQGPNKGPCSYKALENGFCKKHARFEDIEMAKAEGKTLCQPLRGCFNVVSSGKARCDSCRKVELIEEQERGQIKRDEAAKKEVPIGMKQCTLCYENFSPWVNGHNKESVRCLPCYEKQNEVEQRRPERDINYRKRVFDNLETAYRIFKQDCVNEKRGRIIENQLSFEEWKGLVLAECHYCGHFVEGEAVGIDRVDNEKGYLLENCVAACWTCNRMKLSHEQEFFLEHCEVLAGILPLAGHVERWPHKYSTTQTKYETYLQGHNAKRSHLEWGLTKEQYYELGKGACYLCGYQNPAGIGIDRVDNEKGYLLENCRACCWTCNQMKGSFVLEDVLEKAKKVADRKSEIIPI